MQVPAAEITRHIKKIGKIVMVEFGYRPKLITNKMSDVLDHSRWIAALAVSCAHLRNLLFPDFLGGTPFTKMFYFFTLFGTQAVVVFFVASGLLVGGSIVRAVNRGHFNRSGYAIDRASRLYIVLIPAIVLTEALRIVGLSTTCQQPEAYLTIAANALALQNFTNSPLCNNHPLWSLSSEAFFYLIAPGLLFASLRRSVVAGIFTATLFAIAAYFWSLSYMTPLFGLLLWLLGLAPWFIRINIPAGAGLLPFIAVLVLSRSHHTINEFVDAFALAVAFTFFLCCRFGEGRTLMRKAGSVLAGFSYSLYLVHMPIAQAIASKVSRPFRPTDYRSYAVYIGALALIIGVAWLFGWMFERRTKVVRDWLRLHFGPRPVVA